MKKTIYLLLVGVLVLSLTGCGKKLTCEKKLTEANDGIEVTSNITVTFDGDLSDKISILYVFETEAKANAYYEYVKDTGYGYVLNGKNITIDRTFSGEDRSSYKDTKAELLDEGYTCK